MVRVRSCPTGSLSPRKSDGGVKQDRALCIRCGKCVTACPTEAVRFRYAFGGSGACSKLSQKPIIEENKGE